MDGLAILADIHLGIPFGIARRLRPFRPRIAVAVQRHAFDAESGAALLELRGPVARANRPQIRKQRPIAGKVAQEFRHVCIEAHNGNCARFHAPVADDVIAPVNILGLKECQVGLRRAQIPRQFVERLAFGIVLAGDNRQMFGQSDARVSL